MPRPRVTANTTRPTARRVQISDPELASVSSAPEDGSWQELSFLSGAHNTMDTGLPPNRPSGYPALSFEESYERMRALRRHTVEPGHSTFTRDDFSS